MQYADLNACNTYRPPMESLRSLDLPTLVLSGRRDQMTGPKAGPALAAQLPNATLVEVEAGHSMMSEAPRATLDALRRFFASPGTRA